MMNDHNRNRFEHIEGPDEIDALLRRWHEVNAQRARAGREALMQRLAVVPRLSEPGLSQTGRAKAIPTRRRIPGSENRGTLLRAAASFALMITLIALLIPVSQTPVMAQQQEIMIPDGGKLEAHDERGSLIGPCALKHTDVNVQISGPFTRVTLKQQYHNPYKHKIEAVYTFPLSHRAAVDRMTMTIGDRIVEAEVKERQQARQMYESARQAGYVASLLEQERPNIFTQSVANIEPNAEVLIEISYVEMLESKDGEYSFEFPMVVAPRYIPGYISAQAARLPAELKSRHGVILRGPAQLNAVHAHARNLAEGVRLGLEFLPGNPGVVKFAPDVDSVPYPAHMLQRALKSAQPIEFPGAMWWGNDQSNWPQISIGFVALYCDGTQEVGVINADGTGQINNRWFYADLAAIDRDGTGYEPDTDQVPDASRITPMPVRPPTRAGHDISMNVSIDTGGPAIVNWKSDLHEVFRTDVPQHKNLGNRIDLALKNQNEIPNRDFVLRWKLNDDSIQESMFVYANLKNGGTGVSPVREATTKPGTGETPVPSNDGFITLMIAPPTRVAPEDIPPRELIFVLDTSGSMSGQPIEAAKSVMAKAIETMRERDTFNIITFSGDTHILWDKPRASTPANRAEAQAFLASRSGGGGTEMMQAIHAALAPTPKEEPKRALTPEQLANLPADGRAVEVEAPMRDLHALDATRHSLNVRDGLTLDMDMKAQLPSLTNEENVVVHLRGEWHTRNAQRVLVVHNAVLASSPPHNGTPLRLVMFLTDGQVGNDDAIINAVRENSRNIAGGRVFSFGIGNSPNRYLLEGIAKAGRGEVEYVNLQTDPAPIVERFVKRIETPVLTNIQIALEGDGLQIDDAVPPLDAIPDVFDRKPIVIHARLKLPLPLGEGRGEGGPKLKLTGATGAGPYERVIDLKLREKTDQHSMLPALWARAKVGELEATDLHAISNGSATPAVQQQIIALGEQFNIMTRFTSFVAVEKSRLTIAGKPVLVPIPVELPDGMEWEGVFGGDGECGIANDRVQALSSKLRFDQLFQLSQASLARGDYEAAAREVLTAKVRLGQQKQVLAADEIEKRNAEADSLLATVEQLRVRAVTARQLQVDAAHSSRSDANGYEAQRVRAQRDNQVNDALGRVRQLQQETKYNEALQVIDEILFLDDNNPSALALKDVITTTQAYRDYNNEQQIKELRLGKPLVEGRPSLIPPRPNMSGPRPSADASASGVVDVDDLLKVVNYWGGGPVATSAPTAGQPIEVDRNTIVRNPFILPGHGKEGANLYSLTPSQQLFVPTATSVGYINANPGTWNQGFYDGVSHLNANSATQFSTYGQPTAPMLGDIPLVGEASSANPSAGVRFNFYGAPQFNLETALQQGGGFGGGGGAGGGGGGRVVLERILADSDGDGFTDSFWFVQSSPNKQDVSQVKEIAPTPPDWPQVSFRRGFDSNSQGLPVNRAVWQKLQGMRIPIGFNNNTFEQIANYFSSVTGIDVKPNWESLATIGITRESTITIKHNDVTAAEALQLVLDQLGSQVRRPRFDVKDGVVVIEVAGENDDAARAKPQAAGEPPTIQERETRRREIETRDAERAAAIAELQRIGRLRKVIDRRLWSLVKLETDSPLAITSALSHTEKEIAVVVLLGDMEKATLASVKDAGLRVDDVAPRINVIGGMIAADKLDDLALVSEVRRIEAVSTE